MTLSLLSKRLQLFPNSAKITGTGESARLTIANCDLQQLARDFGTPLYLYDALTLQNAAQEYRQALKQYYPGLSAITYAAKAFLCTAIAQWVQQEGLWLDCTNANEMAIAAQAGLDPSFVVVHGVNKSPQDLQAAFKHAGIIVVDNLSELQQIVQIWRDTSNKLPDLWLRLRPGVAVETHRHTQTGNTDSKFGMSTTEITEAVRLCLQEELPLKGLHFHLGSNIHDPTPFASAISRAFDLIAGLKKIFHWTPEVISPGGGWGAPYHEDDLPYPSIAKYVHFISSRIVNACQERRLSLPRLQLEPGRSLVARAGVAIYRVGVVKQTGNIRWLLVDGGLADNPRPALYGSRYTALPVSQPDRLALNSNWIAGPFCESSDILIREILLPEIQPGELLTIPVCGAYQLSMASNYNGASKPAVLWLHNGSAQIIQDRETYNSILQRDHPLPQ